MKLIKINEWNLQGFGPFGISETIFVFSNFGLRVDVFAQMSVLEIKKLVYDILIKET